MQGETVENAMLSCACQGGNCLFSLELSAIIVPYTQANAV